MLAKSSAQKSVGDNGGVTGAIGAKDPSFMRPDDPNGDIGAATRRGLTGAIGTATRRRVRIGECTEKK